MRNVSAGTAAVDKAPGPACLGGPELLSLADLYAEVPF